MEAIPTMRTNGPRRAGAARRLPIALVLLCLACGCAGADAPAGPDTQVEKIRALIGDAACDSDAQCRTIPIGAKACGGPEAYLAWSTKRTDATALREAAAGHGTLPPPARLRPGMRSDCMLVTDPGAYCAPSGSPGTGAAPNRGGACRLRSTRQGSKGPVD